MTEETMRPQHGFRLCDDPVTVSRDPDDSEEKEQAPDGEASLPSSEARPILALMARNPAELFICWSVDWSQVFRQGEARDQPIYLRLSGNGRERLVAIEPMSGYCFIDELEPGSTYSAALGFFTLERQWRLVVDARETTLPLPMTLSTPVPVEVATIPLHLSFHRLMELMPGTPRHELASALARWQRDGAGSSSRTADDDKLMAYLGVCVEELEEAARLRAALEEAPLLARIERSSSSRSSSYGS